MEGERNGEKEGGKEGGREERGARIGARRGRERRRRPSATAGTHPDHGLDRLRLTQPTLAPRAMAKGKKAARIIIKMASTAGTGFFYTTKKNPKNTPVGLGGD